MPFSTKAEKRDYDRDYRAANKDRIRERQRTWEAENRDHVNAQARASYASRSPEERGAYYARNREALIANVSRRRLAKLYGITVEEYMAMFDAQRGVCAMCEQPETAGRNGKAQALSVDHCHATGKVRALLCTACNKMVGIVEKHQERVRAYLDRHGAKL